MVHQSFCHVKKLEKSYSFVKKQKGQNRCLSVYMEGLPCCATISIVVNFSCLADCISTVSINLC